MSRERSRGTSAILAISESGALRRASDLRRLDYFSKLTRLKELTDVNDENRGPEDRGPKERQREEVERQRGFEKR
jgi:hypothetical protein